MDKIYEVRDLKAQQQISALSTPATGPEQPSPPSGLDVTQTDHVTCFATFPFSEDYHVVLEALRDVLEIAPYFWEVVRPNPHQLANQADENVAHLIARSHCYALDVTQNNDDVMMQVGQIYWSYPKRPLFLLQRQGRERQLTEQLDNCVRMPCVINSTSSKPRESYKPKPTTSQHEPCAA